MQKMNDMLALILIVSAALLILLVVLIILVCTYHKRFYRSFKKPVKTMGIIDDVEAESDEEGGTSYIIAYSYTDNAGMRRTNKFRWGRSIGKAGDKLALFYDSQAPQNSIADCQLKYGKGLWWKVLIVLAVIIVPSIVLGIYFTK